MATDSDPQESTQPVLITPGTDEAALASPLSTSERINVLCEEYRALYAIASLRMSSLDQRALLAWGALLAFWSGFESLGTNAQLALLLGVPILVVLLFRTTINHARSFEDVLRRIDEIERHVGRLAGEPLLQFQSRHPSRGRAIGGRTGRESVRAMLGASLLVLASCGFNSWLLRPSFNLGLFTTLAMDCGFALIAVCHAAWRLRRYRYRKQFDTD